MDETLLNNPAPPANQASKQRFELSDHLGSVRAVVSGVKDANNVPTILSLTDYTDFGMTMNGRSFVGENNRFGYQGSERDPEYLSGSAYTTEFRMLDVRLGRWFSPDPIMQPSKSAYASMNNNPLRFIDPLGLSSEPPGGIPNAGGTSYQGEGADEGYGCWGGSCSSPSPSENPIMIFDVSGLFDKVQAGEATQAQIAYVAKVQEVIAKIQASSKGRVKTNVSIDQDGNFTGVIAYETEDKQFLEVYTDISENHQEMKPANMMNLTGNILGGISLSYDTWENTIYNRTTYKVPKTGEYKNLYKTHKGKIKTIAGEPVPRSANAAARIKVNTWVEVGGKVLNGIGVAFTLYQIYEEGEITLETGADLVFGCIAFVPGVGWAISGTYFIGKLILSPPDVAMTEPSPDQYNNQEIYIVPQDNTKIHINVNIYISPNK